MNSSPTRTQPDRTVDEGRLAEVAPHTGWQYVTVTFGGANSDYMIEHQLTPSNPEDIDYQVVRKDRACDVYHDQSGTRRDWASSYIVLRSTVANAVVDLLLTTRRT